MTTSSCILVSRSSWGGVAVAVRAHRSSVKVGITGSGHAPVPGSGRSTNLARPSPPSSDRHPSSPSSSLPSLERPGEWARADVDGAVSRRRHPLSGGARRVRRRRRPSHRRPSGPSLLVVAI